MEEKLKGTGNKDAKDASIWLWWWFILERITCGNICIAPYNFGATFCFLVTPFKVGLLVVSTHSLVDFSLQRRRQLKKPGRTWWWWSGLETWSWQMTRGPTITSSHPLANLNWRDAFNTERGGRRGEPLWLHHHNDPVPSLLRPSPSTLPPPFYNCFCLFHVGSWRRVGDATVSRPSGCWSPSLWDAPLFRSFRIPFTCKREQISGAQ